VLIQHVTTACVYLFNFNTHRSIFKLFVIYRGMITILWCYTQKFQ